jgi:hypothetical protein
MRGFALGAHTIAPIHPPSGQKDPHMSNRWPVRRVVVALSVVAAVVSVGVFDAVFTGVAVAAKTPAAFTQGPAGRAFYNPSSPLPAGGHGKLIWARRVPAPKGAIAWKVLYKSKLVSGKMVPVSGLVISPTGKAPKGGRKVIAWAHGTLGGARSCATSSPPLTTRVSAGRESTSTRSA